jgi:hypothetical protein
MIVKAKILGMAVVALPLAVGTYACGKDIDMSETGLRQYREFARADFEGRYKKQCNGKWYEDNIIYSNS